MSWWDDLAHAIGQWIWQSMGDVLGAVFSPIVSYLFGQVIAAIEFTPSLNYPFIQQLYGYTYGVFVAAMMVVLVAIGIYYVSSPFIEKKVSLRVTGGKLLGAVIIASAAFLIGNLAISLANQLSSGAFSLLGCSQTSCGTVSNWLGGIGGQVTGDSGFLAPVIDIVAIILLFTILIENGVRILMIFFTFIILPWGLLLWAFPTTQSYGTKIIKMFAEWIFVGVFMSIVITLTILSMGQINNWGLQMVLFLGGLSLTAAVPKIMTDSGAAVSNVGQAVTGGVLGGTMMSGGFSSGGASGGGAAGAFKGLAGKGGGPGGAMGALKGGHLGSLAQGLGGKMAGGAANLARSGGHMMAFRPAAGAATLGAAGGMAVAGGLVKLTGKGGSAVKDRIASRGAVKAGMQAGMSPADATGAAKAVQKGWWSPQAGARNAWKNDEKMMQAPGTVKTADGGEFQTPHGPNIHADGNASRAFRHLEERVKRKRGW
jgi:hypothetical protein